MSDDDNTPRRFCGYVFRAVVYNEEDGIAEPADPYCDFDYDALPEALPVAQKNDARAVVALYGIEDDGTRVWLADFDQQGAVKDTAS
jgi:hypothetical protein